MIFDVLGVSIFIEVLIFVLILVVGLVYGFSFLLLHFAQRVEGR